jgi:bifunctional non-homologous end joining protein LigD
MPEVVAPMLAVAGALPATGDWAVEFAWEGLRCVCYVQPDGVRLVTAGGRDVAASFPELVEPLMRRAPRDGMVLDATVVAAVGDGRLPRRRLLQRRTAAARASPALLRRTPVGLMIGDLLWLAGRSTVTLPYRRRRELLEGLGLARPPVVVAPSFPVAEAEPVMRTAEEYGAEALHAKHLDAPYRPGRRSRSWVRVPLRRTGIVVVGGWTTAGPRHPDRVGALLLGVPVTGTGGRLRYVGRVGVGAGAEQREIAAHLARLRRADSPFATPPPPAASADAQWVEPLLVGRVDFAEWTLDGRLRLPVWRGRSSADGLGSVRATTGDDPAWARRRVPPVRASPGGAAEAAIPPQTAGEGRVAPAGSASSEAGEGAVPRAGSAGLPGAGAGSAEPGAADPGVSSPDPGAGGSRVEARRLDQHFVYNSLNTIASLVRTDPRRARELLLGFADLTRATDRPDGASTLGDELAVVRAYLDLEQARFGRRLQVEITVDPALHGLPMRPRRVLDAVRATVQQRIEPRPGGGTVTVTAERAGDGCVVRVGDRDPDDRAGEPTLVAPG